jgi:arylsulfatase A-like enzyme
VTELHVTIDGPASSGSGRRALLLVTLVAVALLGVFRPWYHEPVFELDGRRDLLLDLDRVELMEGFPDGVPLQVWGEFPRPNLDRQQVAVVPFPRNGRLRWHLGSDRPGRFSARVARLTLGSQGDTSSCRFIVQALGPGLTPAAQIEVPGVSLDGNVAENVTREGPFTSLSLALPDGAQTLVIQVVSEGVVPPGSYVTLLSPRVVQQPIRLPVKEALLEYDDTLLLTTLGDGGAPTEVEFGRKTTETETDVPVMEPDVAAVSAFTGRIGRYALAFTGEARFEATVDLTPESVLRGATSLDDRLPAGSRAELEVLVDGTSVVRVPVQSSNWVELEQSLGEFAGKGRRLTLASRVLHHSPAPVERNDPDYARGVRVPVQYTAHTVRLGFSEPRITRRRAVPLRAATAEHPSVIVIQVETLRADVLEAFGGSEDGLSPNISRLAERSTTYSHACVPSPWTLPSTASLLTGLLPSVHGVLDPVHSVIPDSLPTLAELARAQGIATGAFVTNTLLRRDAGFARGFTTFGALPYRNARQVNDLAETYLENHAGQQFLLFLHYFDPHAPMDAPGEWANRFVDAKLVDRSSADANERVMDQLKLGLKVSPGDADVSVLRSRYLGEIAWFDEQLGRLLSTIDRMGLAPTTAIVFTADHGEEFMDHGFLGHGPHIHQETVRVPLLVTSVGALNGYASGGRPRAPVNTRVTQVVSTSSVFAEVLALLDVEHQDPRVQPQLPQPGEDAVGRPFVFIETNRGLAVDGMGDPFRRHLRAVRSAAHMLVWTQTVAGESGEGSFCFYDLEADPLERSPMPAIGKQADWHRERLFEMLRTLEADALPGPLAGSDSGTLADLRALGYLDAGAPMGTGLPPCDQ